MKANPLARRHTRAARRARAARSVVRRRRRSTCCSRRLRDEIPGKLLGRCCRRNRTSTVRLIEALSGTRSDAVEDVLQRHRAAFPRSGRRPRRGAGAREMVAAEAARAREPAATLTGELEFFGLPSVMQSLGEMRATGMLTLMHKQGQAAAKLVFVDGKFLNAQMGHDPRRRGALRGAGASDHRYVRVRPVSAGEDEQRHRAARDHGAARSKGCGATTNCSASSRSCPTSMTLTKTNVKPTPHDEEERSGARSRGVDQGIVRREHRGVGAPGGDRFYRVRRLVAHWLEQGALVAMSEAGLAIQSLRRSQRRQTSSDCRRTLC